MKVGELKKIEERKFKLTIIPFSNNSHYFISDSSYSLDYCISCDTKGLRKGQFRSQQRAQEQGGPVSMVPQAAPSLLRGYFVVDSEEVRKMRVCRF